MLGLNGSGAAEPKWLRNAGPALPDLAQPDLSTTTPAEHHEVIAMTLGCVISS